MGIRQGSKKHLEESLNARIKRENENRIIEQSVKNSEVEIPECMIEAELDKIVQDFEMRLSYQGFKFEDYLAQMGLTLEKYREERKEFAKDTVKTRLVMEQIIMDEKLGVSQEEMDGKLTEIASKYKKSLEDYKKSMGERELIYFENAILMEKLTTFLTSNNKII